MFKCRECGKEFGDWHALGGHMRTHRAAGSRVEAGAGKEGMGKEALGRALGRLSEMSGEEAWRIVVGWIMDVYREKAERDEAMRAYRLRAEQSEARIEEVRGELKALQRMVVGAQIYKGESDQL